MRQGLDETSVIGDSTDMCIRPAWPRTGASDSSLRAAPRLRGDPHPGLPPGFTGTTITGCTPPSAVHPSPASPTSPAGTTAGTTSAGNPAPKQTMRCATRATGHLLTGRPQVGPGQVRDERHGWHGHVADPGRPRVFRPCAAGAHPDEHTAGYSSVPDQAAAIVRTPSTVLRCEQCSLDEFDGARVEVCPSAEVSPRCAPHEEGG